MDEYLAALLQKLYKLADYDNLRTAGEVASMTPTPLGDVASGMLAVDDLRKGNYGDAALNAVGLLPFVPGMAGVISSKVDPKLLEQLYKEKAIKRSEFYPTDVTVNMTPDDYLALTYPLERGKESVEASIKEIKDVLQSGGKLDDVPNLVIDKKGKVSSQEGRHRATAMKELGYTDYPVVIGGTSEAREKLRNMTKDQIKEYMRTQFGKLKSQPNPRKSVEWYD